MRTSLIATALALTVAGCGNDAEPAPAPTTSAESTDEVKSTNAPAVPPAPPPKPQLTWEPDSALLDGLRREIKVTINSVTCAIRVPKGVKGQQLPFVGEGFQIDILPLERGDADIPLVDRVVGFRKLTKDSTAGNTRIEDAEVGEHGGLNVGRYRFTKTEDGAEVYGLVYLFQPADGPIWVIQAEGTTDTRDLMETSIRTFRLVEADE